MRVGYGDLRATVRIDTVGVMREASNGHVIDEDVVRSVRMNVIVSSVFNADVLYLDAVAPQKFKDTRILQRVGGVVARVGIELLSLSIDPSSALNADIVHTRGTQYCRKSRGRVVMSSHWI